MSGRLPGGSAPAGFLHHEARGALIQTADAPAERHGGAAFVGGYVPPPVDALFALRQCRDRRPADAFETDAVYDFRMNGTYSYGGLLYDHFGHVMAEMVHRILTTRRHFAERPWIFVGLRGGAPLLGHAALPAAFRAATDYLDVAPENVLCLHANAIVERLQVAEQGSEFGGGPKPGYLDLLADHAGKLDRMFAGHDFPERVFVSRSSLPPSGNTLGDRFIESALAALGWHIFFPERFPLAYQMQVFRRSKVVAWSEGSAAHGLELLGGDALARSILIERRPSHRGVFERVMAPRAGWFSRIEGARLVGSYFPYESSAVYLHDIRALVAGFRDVADLSALDIGAYVAAARADLEDYIAHMRGLHPGPTGGDTPETLLARFEALAAEL